MMDTLRLWEVAPSGTATYWREVPRRGPAELAAAANARAADAAARKALADARVAEREAAREILRGEIAAAGGYAAFGGGAAYARRMSALV